MENATVLSFDLFIRLYQSLCVIFTLTLILNNSTFNAEERKSGQNQRKSLIFTEYNWSIWRIKSNACLLYKCVPFLYSQSSGFNFVSESNSQNWSSCKSSNKQSIETERALQTTFSRFCKDACRQIFRTFERFTMYVVGKLINFLPKFVEVCEELFFIVEAKVRIEQIQDSVLRVLLLARVFLLTSRWLT